MGLVSDEFGHGELSLVWGNVGENSTVLLDKS